MMKRIIEATEKNPNFDTVTLDVIECECTSSGPDEQDAEYFDRPLIAAFRFIQLGEKAAVHYQGLHVLGVEIMRTDHDNED